MNESLLQTRSEEARRLHADMLDSLDEELEMEIDDARMDALIDEATATATAGMDLDRRRYFR